MQWNRFSEGEDALILRYRDAGMPYVAIAEKLEARGYSRSAATIRTRYNMLKENQRKEREPGGVGNGQSGVITECGEDKG